MAQTRLRPARPRTPRPTVLERAEKLRKQIEEENQRGKSRAKPSVEDPAGDDRDWGRSGGPGRHPPARLPEPLPKQRQGLDRACDGASCKAADPERHPG